MVAPTVSLCTNPACDAGGSTTDTTNTCDLSERCANACAAYGRVCPCAARAAGRAACNAIKKLSDNSKIFHGKPDFVKLDCDDLVIGKKLGEGGFSLVHEVVLQAGDEQGQTFAVKYLKRKIMVNQKNFELGAADLAVEANFLAALDHPSIVKLHGVTAGSVETNVASGKECGFFIVIDRLYDTLENRIEKWKDEAEKHTGGIMYRRSTEFREKRKSALNMRLKAAVEIADAMEYLHNKNIIFRDLKPDNIGYDKEFKLKLFDFGLAKELKAGDERPDGKYNLTGNTGSRRYMAPEVAKEIAYDLSVDVYSFGILLWELCALEKPFFGFSSGKHMQQVVMGGERPRLDTPNTSWFPVNLQWLLKKCWSAFAVSRPSFELIKRTLQDVIDGNECIPTKTVESKEEVLIPPAGGFALMRSATRRRHRTTGEESEVTTTPTKGSPAKKGIDYKSIPKPSPTSRISKSFGFLLGHQSPNHETPSN
jgi:serine/threonine protein kinase